MKNKGFTLVELLAVITILAIIAIIVVPTVIGIINDSRDQSVQRSAELYESAVKNAVYSYSLKGNKRFPYTKCTVLKKGNLKCGDETIEVDIDNPDQIEGGGEIEFSKGVITKITGLAVSGKKFDKADKDSKLVMRDESSNNQGGQQELVTGYIYRNSETGISIGDTIANEELDVYCGVLTIDGEPYNTCDDNIGFEHDECEAILNNFLASSFSASSSVTGTCEPGTITTGLDPSEYYTEETKSNMNASSYLKHYVVDNIVTDSWACFKYIDPTTNQEVDDCLKGDDENAFGSFDGMSEVSVQTITNPSGNIEKVYRAKAYAEANEASCSFSDFYAECKGNGIMFSARVTGAVEAGDCYVEKDGGYSACEK